MPATPATGSPGGSWETGTTVGRYVLLAPLATGGMAEIWLARQSGMKGFEKLVVVKRMTDALEAENEFVEMFLTEARLAAQLNHPNVVQIYELGEQAGSFYIAMEYLDGENLAIVRRTGNQHKLPLMDHLSARLIARAAEGLHYAHTRVGLDGKPLSIVHRDISPQNLIVTYDGGLKIVDFGIAKAATQHTLSGKLKGKLAYMSPEQARGEQVDARSDVFALGIVLFELLTRTRLLPKMADLEILTTMAGEGALPRPSSRRRDIPRPLEDIVMAAMTRRREERFQSAREMQDALEDWLRQTGASATNHDVADYMKTVFATRIRERRALIETAMQAELTPHSADNIRAMAKVAAPGTGTSVPDPSVNVPLPGANRVPLIIGAAAAAVLLVGGGLFFALRSPSEPQPLTATPPPTKVPPPVLVVDTVPSGAALIIDGKNEGTAPLTLEGLGTGAHTVVARLPGYTDSSRTVKLARPGERVLVELALAPLPKPVEPAKPPVEPVVTPKPVKPTPVASRGKLTLKTVPWTTVFFGKRKLGDTPLLNVPLPAGKHVLKLVNPDKKLELSIEVDIKANETTVKKLSL